MLEKILSCLKEHDIEEVVVHLKDGYKVTIDRSEVEKESDFNSFRD